MRLWAWSLGPAVALTISSLGGLGRAVLSGSSEPPYNLLAYVNFVAFAIGFLLALFAWRALVTPPPITSSLVFRLPARALLLPCKRRP